MKNTGVVTYCLTKDGFFGMIVERYSDSQNKLKVLVLKGGLTTGKAKVINPDDIYCQDTNLIVVKNKAKQLRREKFSQFSKFQNIVLNISSITYYGLQFNFDYKVEKKLSRVLKVYNLRLVHLKQHDAYVLLDTKDISKNKNIEIQSLCIHTGEVIGRQGRNINQIKEELGIRNISVRSLSFDEFEPIKKEFQELLEKLETYLKD